jgi:hypothetical protein
VQQGLLFRPAGYGPAGRCLLDFKLHQDMHTIMMSCTAGNTSRYTRFSSTQEGNVHVFCSVQCRGGVAHGIRVLHQCCLLCDTCLCSCVTTACLFMNAICMLLLCAWASAATPILAVYTRRSALQSPVPNARPPKLPTIYSCML